MLLILAIGTLGMVASTLRDPARRRWRNLPAAARQVTVALAGGLTTAAALIALAMWIGPRLNALAVPTGGLSLPATLSWAAVALAVATGAGHALRPGHGKSLMAAMLLGGDGGVRRAALLSGAVAASHTASVAVVALVTVAVSRSASATALLVLQVAAGLLMAALGVWVLLRHRRHADGEAGHVHGHGQSGHGVAEHSGPGSSGQMLLAGVVGGLVPSPTALALLLAAVAAGRAGLGLLLVLAFSGGLAGVLLAVGVSVVRGRGRVGDRWAETEWFVPLTQRLADASAVVVSLAGLTLAAAAAVGT